METVIRTAADIARAFSSTPDANHDAALSRLLSLGALAGDADAMCLYWRVRERVLAVDRQAELAPGHTLLRHTRRTLWPWLNRQPDPGASRILLAPPLDKQPEGDAIALLPLCDPQPALAGLVAVQVNAAARERLLGEWRAEAVGFADLVQDWLQAELDPDTAVLSQASFHEEIKRWTHGLDQRRRMAVVLSVHLDHLQHVERACGEQAALAAMKDFLALAETRLRGRDLMGRIGRHSIGVFLRQCVRRDAERVASALHSSLQDYHFQWEDRRYSPVVRVEIKPLQAPQSGSILGGGDVLLSTPASTGESTVSTSAGEMSSDNQSDATNHLDNVVSLPGRTLDEADASSERSVREQPADIIRGHSATALLRAQPCITLADRSTVACYRLRGFSVKSGGALGLDGIAQARQRYCQVLDHLAGLRQARQRLPVFMIDIDVTTLSDAVVGWLIADCDERSVMTACVCVSFREQVLSGNLRQSLPLLRRLGRAGFGLCMETGMQGVELTVLLERLSLRFVRLPSRWMGLVDTNSLASSRFLAELRSVRDSGAKLLCAGVDSDEQLDLCLSAKIELGYGRVCGATCSLEQVRGMPVS